MTTTITITGQFEPADVKELHETISAIDARHPGREFRLFLRDMNPAMADRLARELLPDPGGRQVSFRTCAA